MKLTLAFSKYDIIDTADLPEWGPKAWWGRCRWADTMSCQPFPERDVVYLDLPLFSFLGSVFHSNLAHPRGNLATIGLEHDRPSATDQH